MGTVEDGLTGVVEVRLHRFGNLPRQVATESCPGDDTLGQAVRCQAVGTVHPGAGHLADGVQTGELGRPVEGAGTPPHA